MENKRVRNTKKVLHEGTQFKSSIEAYCYKKLVENNIEFEYEKNKFCLIEGCRPEKFNFYQFDKNKELKLDATKLRDISYTPDFTGSNWIIETKGFKTPEYSIKIKIFRKNMESQDKYFYFFEPKNQKQVLECIEFIKNLNQC